eukprot:2231296-Pyramimonas_sp.AAC.1
MHGPICNVLGCFGVLVVWVIRIPIAALGLRMAALRLSIMSIPGPCCCPSLGVLQPDRRWPASRRYKPHP